MEPLQTEIRDLRARLNALEAKLGQASATGAIVAAQGRATPGAAGVGVTVSGAIPIAPTVPGSISVVNGIVTALTLPT